MDEQKPQDIQSEEVKQHEGSGMDSSSGTPDENIPKIASSQPASVSDAGVSPAPSAETVSTPTVSSPPPSSTPLKKERFVPWVIFLILIFVGFLVFAAWYFQFQLQKNTVSAAPTPPSSVTVLPAQLVVGTDPTFQPMEYLDKGNMVGYDIDLTNLLAKQLRVKVTFKNITFDNLFPALNQHKIDLIISAVTITPERQKMYSFSNEYLNAGQVIITQKTNTTIKSPKQLAGLKIGVQEGTTDEQQALKYTSSNLVIKFSDYNKATAALVAGTIDAVITDLPSAKGIVSSNPSLKIASDPFTNDYYGIVLRKGDPNVSAVNKALDQLRVRGFLTQLKYKWLD